MKQLKLSIAAFLSIFFVQNLQAQRPGGMGGERPNPAEMFAKIDTNSDGFLSFEEFQQMPERKARGNSNEAPSKQEMFNRLDANNDNLVSLEEMQSGRKGKGKGNGEMRNGSDLQRPEKNKELNAEKKAEMKGEMKMKKGKLKKKLKMADSNRDKQISFQEFSTIDFNREINHREMFTKLDVDQNGFIDKTDLKAKKK